MSRFIPNIPEKQDIEIPYFEDNKLYAGKGVTLSIDRYEKRIEALLKKLGAYRINFVDGKFDNRDGLLITFIFDNMPGRIECAALPIRQAKNRDRSIAQALWLLGNWLEAEYHCVVYRPGNMPLIPYLIGTGDLTVMESLQKNGEINLLPPGKSA